MTGTQPHERPPAGNSPAPQRRVCGARTKGNGTPCQLPPAPGRTRCRLHGGATPQGCASPHFKHGRYSAVLPKGLAEGYEAARQDPELLSLDDECALLTARINELLGTLTSGGASQRWESLKAAWRTFRAACNAADKTAQAAALDNVNRLILQGTAEADVWKELGETIDRRARVARLSWQRQVDLQQTMTSQQALAFAMAILDVVIRHTPEQDRRRVIASDIQLLIRDRSRGDAQAPEREQPLEIIVDPPPAGKES